MSTEELEKHVDIAGLTMTLYRLAEIAEAKAEHLESVWQDARAAKKWLAASKKLSAMVKWARVVGPS
jgi:hypothetical protein